jgi:hypothetical protein
MITKRAKMLLHSACQNPCLPATQNPSCFLIVHEHVSWPVDLASGHAVMKLVPQEYRGEEW